MAEHGVRLTKAQILDVLEKPDAIEHGYANRGVAQKALDKTHVLRVVYEEQEGELRVITFDPARKERYESKI